VPWRALKRTAPGRVSKLGGSKRAWAQLKPGLDLYYAERRAAVLERLIVDARASAEAARGRLASGAGSVDEAIAAEVETARLEDRAAEAGAAVVAMRAELRRWIGEAADAPLGDAAPRFNIDAEALRHHLRRHPALGAYEAEREVAEAGLRMARAERWPDWSWEVSYGRRDPALEDMASVEVRVGLPLFQAWRQGPLIDARRADLARAGAERDATLREHEAMLEGGLAQYAALDASVVRARDVRLPLARQRAEATSGAFAAGNSTASALIATRRDALEAELDLFMLEERLALTGVALTLQYGETAP
jgi:cobalt-zinc-cadmium efflux system outer membrane protein